MIGSLAACIRHFGRLDAPARLRWTTKFDGVDPLLTLPHRGRTRAISVNASEVARHFEGGTASMPARFAAMRKIARAGYSNGLTIAPIMPVDNRRERYCDLLGSALKNPGSLAPEHLRPVTCIAPNPHIPGRRPLG